MIANTQLEFPVLSFFSGGGFLDMGFELAGFKLVWSNEYDLAFAKLNESGIRTWRSAVGKSNGSVIMNTKSLLDLSSNEILNEAFGSQINKNFGMIGGPPCQDFSLNGKLNGFHGDRGKLTIVYIQKVLELQPTFFVMENVPGLISRKETRDYLESILEPLRKDYFIVYRKLNSLHYGVPQSRERIFYIGIKMNKVSSELRNKSNSDKWFDFPTGTVSNDLIKKIKQTKSSPFGNVPCLPTGIPEELTVNSCLVSDTDIDIVHNANEYPKMKVSDDFLSSINEGDTKRRSFKRLHRYKYSPTACYGNNEIHLHPYKNRRLSVRETLRIQGVPDSYILPKNISLTKKYKMIGNGVPVPLALAVATALKDFLVNNEIIS